MGEFDMPGEPAGPPDALRAAAGAAGGAHADDPAA